MTDTETEFDEAQQLTIIDELRVAAGFQAYRVHYVATEPTHIHVLVSWKDEAVFFTKFRAGIRQSVTRRLTREFGQRHWLSEGGSRRKVFTQEHFDYLVQTYLPRHGGWKWSENRGVHK